MQLVNNSNIDGIWNVKFTEQHNAVFGRSGYANFMLLIYVVTPNKIQPLKQMWFYNT